MGINLAFFGLTREPFGPAPDPSFLYLSPTHDEALAQLVFGVAERKAFVLLTGAIGTGKTTLLRALMQRVGEHTTMAFVTHSALSFEGIVECIMNGFGIAKPGQSLAQQLLTLQAFLADGARAGQNAVIILDEAQNMLPETLEQIRLLSNLETASEKLLQIVLAGQPELATTLQLPRLRQFAQRLALRCVVSPLNPAETRDYIHARLRMAGAATTNTFSDEAIERIARWSRGVPRMINNLCDHCLVIAYGDQLRRVDRKIVDQAIQYFRRGAQGGGRGHGMKLSFGQLTMPRRALVWASGAGVAVAGAVAAVHLDVVHLVMDLAHSLRDLVAR